MSIKGTPSSYAHRPRVWTECRTILAVVALVLPGCQGSVPQPAATQQAATQPQAITTAAVVEDIKTPGAAAATVFPLEVTDGLERNVKIARPPERIVSLSPKNTEMLFAVGAGDLIVGNTTHCDYPPAAVNVEKVGGFSARSLNLERIVSLKPDLVVSVGDVHVPIIKELERLGIPVIAFTADSFAGLFADLQLLGRITGHEQQAVKLVEGLRSRVERIKDRATAIPASERVTAFYYVWGEPLMGAGPTSYFGEMLQLCGAMNVIEDMSTRFPKLSMEVLLVKNPDVIISSDNHSDLASSENVNSRPGWSQLKAVQSKRVYLLDGGLVSRCTPRTVDALELIAHVVYPAYFDAPQKAVKPDEANGKQP